MPSKYCINKIFLVCNSFTNYENFIDELEKMKSEIIETQQSHSIEQCIGLKVKTPRNRRRKSKNSMSYNKKQKK